jgi:hypothetical protein
MTWTVTPPVIPSGAVKFWSEPVSGKRVTFDQALGIIPAIAVRSFVSPSETKTTAPVGRRPVSVPGSEITTSLSNTFAPLGVVKGNSVPSRAAFEGSVSATTLTPERLVRLARENSGLPKIKGVSIKLGSTGSGIVWLKRIAPVGEVMII